MKAVLTNDDGIRAVGLRALYKALGEAGHEVRVVAPMTEQSAVSSSITMLSPLRAVHIKEENIAGYGVFGTPTDCVKLGMSQLLDGFTPDIVLAGINAGANVGPDIFYSGTVAAAVEAACQGMPALAVSYDNFRPAGIDAHARYAVAVMERIPWDKIPPRRVINLNMPDRPVAEFRGLAVCPPTTAAWDDFYHRREDPRGRSYWWLDGKIPDRDVLPESDKALLKEGWATLTPLKCDFTDPETLTILRRLPDRLA
ncbi:MAG: 5'/3'-nucleotidase SurE [Desulfovibrio sp.]|jgi:5'-nucleotidase|nr:5'/3'-nucleotidase SurE [Desulfovibrio sp.]